MKFKTTSVVNTKEILYNDHYAAIPYNCGSLTGDVIKAGTIVPSNDDNAVGVLLYDVTKEDNPNGAVVIHGFINKAKLPEMPSEQAEKALKQITFI